jgi:hypothetical protein
MWIRREGTGRSGEEGGLEKFCLITIMTNIVILLTYCFYVHLMNCDLVPIFIGWQRADNLIFSLIFREMKSGKLTIKLDLSIL